MLLITSTDQLTELINLQQIKFVRRNQQGNGSNYYLSPSLMLNIYKPIVYIVTPTYIVFAFDKFHNLTLFHFMKSISYKLLNYLKSCFYIDNSKKLYDFFSQVEKIAGEPLITIRCNLPVIKGKYYIRTIVDGVEDTQFCLPRRNAKLESVLIEIKNIWEKDDKLGFNVELREIKN